MGEAPAPLRASATPVSVVFAVGVRHVERHRGRVAGSPLALTHHLATARYASCLVLAACAEPLFVLCSTLYP